LVQGGFGERSFFTFWIFKSDFGWATPMRFLERREGGGGGGVVDKSVYGVT